MELIFYKGKGELLDKAIRWWTWGDYSHCELRFEDHLTFSSSWRDGGVRFRDMPISPSKWDRLQIDIDAESAERMLQWCASLPGTPYDLWGIFGSIIGRSIDDEAAWYCSEICAASLNKFWKTSFPRNITPNKLYQRAVQLPRLFTPTTNGFTSVLERERLAPGRELAYDLLSMSSRVMEQELIRLQTEDLPTYAIVRDKFKEIRSFAE